MKALRIRDFINSGLKEFSRHDNVRSIPRLSDGFKESQRKAMWGMLRRGEHADEIQVERCAAVCSAETLYHHGTGSMESTLIGLATNYAGSNNVNLLEPIGQFGSRLSKEWSAPRYIFTKVSPNFRKYFRKEDDILFDFIEEEGTKIEPRTFFPVLPMSIVNGAQGTGTGHATMILGYKPKDVAKHIENVLLGKKSAAPLVPSFEGFTGTVSKNPETNQITMEGRYEIVNTTTIKVVELPVGFQEEAYKSHLNKLEDKGLVKSYDDLSTEKGFEFVLNVPRTTSSMSHEKLMQTLKLIARDTENLTMWDVDGQLRRFESVEQAIERFVEWRVERYEDRRLKLIEIAKADLAWADERRRFVLFYLKNVDKFKGSGKKVLLELLDANGFTDPDRLLGMPIWMLTKDKIEELEREVVELKKHVERLEADTAKDMYLREVRELTK